MADEIISWPEFVGADAEAVKNQLETKGYNAVILPQGAPCTHDFRLDRVRLFVDDNKIIVQPPTTG